MSAGGIGIRKAMDISLPAFQSSSYSTRMLVDVVLLNTTCSAPANYVEFEEFYEKWTEKSVPDTKPEKFDKCKQKALNLGITEKTASAPESGQWIHAISVPS